jgi:hypothetical protein
MKRFRIYDFGFRIPVSDCRIRRRQADPICRNKSLSIAEYGESVCKFWQPKDAVRICQGNDPVFASGAKTGNC